MSIDLNNNKTFIIGHKVKVKSREELITMIDSSKEYEIKRAFEVAGQVLISKPCDFSYAIDLYKKDGSSQQINVKFLDYTDDNRQPSSNAIELIDNLLGMVKNDNLYLFRRSCGESSGDSDSKKLTKENSYILFDKDGEERIKLPFCNALTLNGVKELMKNKSYDISISNSSYFIRRELNLYTKEEVDEKTFKYGI